MKKKYIFIFVLFLASFLFGLDFFFGKGMTIGLDTVWAPFNGFHSFFSQSIFWHLKDFLLWIFGYKLMSRLYLFITFLLAIGLAILAYKKIVGKIDFGVLFPISFIVINPFFYERLLTQPGILIGILFLGYGMVILLKNILDGDKDIDVKDVFMVGLFFGLSFAIMPHSIFMIGVILLSYLFINYKNIFSTVKRIGIILGIVLLLNFNWLIGTFFLGTNSTVSQLERFNKVNIEVFQTTNMILHSPEITTLQLWGFWGERYYHVLPPNLFNKKFYIAGFFILVLIFYGFYVVFRGNRKAFYFLLFISLFSWVLGTGIASKIWGNLVWFLYEYIPFYKGLREPGKWIGVLMIIYMIVIIFAIANVVKRLESKLKIFGFFVFYFLFLLSWAPTVMFGFRGQLFLTDYPQEYKNLKNIITGNYQKVKYVLFPWHSYMACSWTRGKIVADVLDKVFYPLKIIKASNIEMRTSNAYLYSNYRNKDKFIESFLKTRNLDILRKHNIGGIIFLKTCADFQNYKWLNNLVGLKKIYSGQVVDVYFLEKKANSILNTINDLINE